jgi:putative endonuclease
LSYKRLSLGKSGEDLAVRFLRNKGYSIIGTNYRTRYGEIDIIARQRKILVFVEVKTRKGSFLDTPLSAVTATKQRHISMAAQEYLCKNDLFKSEARFDVIAVHLEGEGAPRIEHIDNAFELNFGF